MSDFKPTQPLEVTGELIVTVDQINTNNGVLAFGQQISVPAATLTTIVTVPSNGLKYITKVICSGIENARWELYIDNTLKMVKRTINRTVEFDFSIPLKLPATSVLDIKAWHNGPGTGVDLEASVLGYAV
jgi:hypothetical protein